MYYNLYQLYLEVIAIFKLNFKTFFLNAKHGSKNECYILSKKNTSTMQSNQNYYYNINKNYYNKKFFYRYFFTQLTLYIKLNFTLVYFNATIQVYKRFILYTVSYTKTERE